MADQPVQHGGLWWTRDPEGRIYHFNESTQTWQPWDPEKTSVTPPPSWAGGPPPLPPRGYAPVYAPVPAPAAHAATNGLAIASLVLGILWIWWIGSVLALIFGYVAKAQIDKSNGAESGRGLAIAGIVLGWIGIATLLLVIVVFVAAQPGVRP